MVECKYRGRVIGWLVIGVDGFLSYSSGLAGVDTSPDPDETLTVEDIMRIWSAA